ncbi:transient receptor potential cation channel subfamily V member 3-like [Biomphalaria glabrata]|uniref:Transient receptor potential cation channel subfamily V member 3-like n=1 Tax=Biomphalaria glabrata TaxID=6526 RepID=A0A9W3B8L5_BIOGL|nr:transient receptor potential cation channel subfamily V member 3-like [Biomphalaria glabrata]
MFSGKVSSLPKPKDQELQHIYNIIKQNNAVQADIGNKTPQMKNSNEAQQKLQDFVDNYSMDEGSIKERLETFRCSADNCDTLLHAAVTYDARIEFIQGILQHCPDLINTTRQGGYEGQNVLHMAIAKGDIELTKVILEASKNKEMLLTTFAKGSKFKKTVVMGETPLSIAVLTLRTEMIDLLLEHGARIDQVNSKGDNVIHTLMKFAKLKREKIPEIIDMLKYLNKTIFRIHNANETREVSDLTKNSVDVNDCVTLKQTKKFETSQDIIHRMWFQENEDLETPLKLTTSRGLWEIFNVMMKMENVFCLPGNFDGANYTHFYDITEIDHIAQSRYTWLTTDKTKNAVLLMIIFNLLFPKRPVSVIEKLCSKNWEDAKPYYNNEILTTITMMRWKLYRLSFYAFGIVHHLVMLIFATSSFCKVRVVNSTCKYCEFEKMYSEVVLWIIFLYSLYVISCEMFRCLFLKDTLIMFRQQHMDIYSYLYRFSLLCFAFCAAYNCYTSLLGSFSNGSFLTTLFSGSFFLSFFLQRI